MDSKSFIMGLDESIFSSADKENFEDTHSDPYAKEPFSQEQLTSAQAQTLIGVKNLLPGAKYYLICTEYEMCVTRINTEGKMEEFPLEEAVTQYPDRLTPMTVRSDMIDLSTKTTPAKNDNTMTKIVILFSVLLLIGMCLIVALGFMGKGV